MSRRTQRVSSVVQGELSNILLSEVNDPRVQCIHILEVDVTGDLKKAIVYFTFSQFHDAPKKKDFYKGLKAVTPFLRRRLSDALDLRSSPELEFREDTHHEDVARVMKIFDAPKTPLEDAPGA